MIKRIAYILVTVCCIIVTVGFFRYNPTVIYEKKVPTSAETIVYLNLREIEYSILSSFLKHPLSQLDFKKSTSKKAKNKTTWLDEVEVPPGLFFYTNEQEFKNFFISSPIVVKQNFEEALKEEGFAVKNINKTTVYSKGVISCVVKGNSLQVLLKKYKGAQILPQLLSKLSHENYFSENDLILRRIKDSKQPIVISTLQGDFFEFSADGGGLKIQGELSEENNLFKPFKASSVGSSIVTVSGKLNTEVLTSRLGVDFKKKFKKLTTLSLDSVTNKWDGVIDFNLSSFVEKLDTIVTYEYDDDFNKVEKKEIQKIITPKVILEVDGDDLCRYLEEKRAIQKLDNEDILTLMPFFTTYSFCEEEGLRFVSIKGDKQIKEVNKKNKFYFLFNVADYQNRDRGIYSIKNKYLSKVKTMQLLVANNNELKATVELKNTSKNFFLQALN
ncbi:hypothetical protein SAMN05444344_1505 [Tenacibaculum mesophilum]|uniref:DUF4340 domain-containing protein n=1 Tax=Tenacibaculum mesophilum TaxID=104268 RepID=A0ABN5T607_9FLAO|nr:hypothetical protein [Tenacibaculum mesophilum]AZJ32757.1 hypothetical protein D6200_09385 [Tenacibaculum mesophilum]QFS28006.1 hypothetical protein F9Y86_06215 [Tenacibaculum mesophilum]SHF74915.1 hypothetical protein SAMN05444344_1505 [Tenacibaculum mesophilum]